MARRAAKVDKFYLAGPMTGYPQFNIPAFDAAANYLRFRGFEVVSPAELDNKKIRAISLASPDGMIATLQSHGKTWGDFLARDVKLIADTGITGIIVLDGWKKSRGARLETFVGSALCGMSVWSLTGPLEGPQLRLTLIQKPELEAAWAGRG